MQSKPPPPAPVVFEAGDVVRHRRLGHEVEVTEVKDDGKKIRYRQKSGFIEMAGKEVFKHAVEKMSKSVLSVLEKAGLTSKDIDLLVPHQANARILNAVAARLEIPEEKVVLTVHDHANTSAASIPLALDYANSQGRIKKGDVVVLEALGGGLTWGSVVLRW
jgi:3-oxoacyl-[acyl-carrier-protein] synthase-3